MLCQLSFLLDSATTYFNTYLGPIAERNNFIIIRRIPSFGHRVNLHSINGKLKTIVIGHEGYETGAYDHHPAADYSNKNIVIRGGYYEDFTLYRDHLAQSDLGLPDQLSMQ